MRIQITQTDGTLPFIEELPSFGIGQLEGYNGVGKSLTVSVLEICAGSRPPISKRAWEGLCDGMGCLTVTATKLNDATELRWVLDGQRLRRASDEHEDHARPQLDWFVEVGVDGHPAQSLDEIRRLFAVERISAYPVGSDGWDGGPRIAAPAVRSPTEARYLPPGAPSRPTAEAYLSKPDTH